MRTNRWFIMIAWLTVIVMLMVACAQPETPTTKPPASTPGAAVGTPGPAATPKPAAEEPKYGGIVETASEADPADLDGIWGTSIFTQVYINSSYNGLLQHDPLDNIKIVPRLAERWDVSPDGTTITFYLRKGVKWHDGQPFGAQDVKATMDLWQAPPPGKFWLGGPLRQLTKGSEVVDDYTIKVNLTRRSNSYLTFLANGNIGNVAPKHILDPQKGVMKNTVVGTGPFKFKKYEAGVFYEAQKNPDYCIQGRPYLDAVRTYIIKDRSTMLVAFRTGRIKVTWVKTGALSGSQAEAIKKDVPQAEVGKMDEYALMSDAWYPNYARKPWNEKKVRQAVSLAVDRQAAVGALSDGVASVGTVFPPSASVIPPAELLQKPGYRQPKDQDVAEAKKLLAEAGYPNGFNSTVLVRGGRRSYEDRAVFAKDQLAKIGIDLQLDFRDEATWSRLRQGRDFDSQVLSVIFYMPDPLGGASYFGPGNDFNYESAKRDELMAKYDTAATDAEKKAAALEFEQFMMDEAPYIAFDWTPELRAWWKELRNLKPAAGYYNNNSWEAVYISK